MRDVPFQLAVFVPELLAEHRREIGTRALGGWKQAVFSRWRQWWPPWWRR